jgi:hypothetical protein
MSHIIDTKPSCHGEATGQEVWEDPMTEEYQSIMKNDVWDIVLRLEGKSVVTSKWIYKIKHAAYGSVKKYKARFMARGFSQVEGIDYEETFAPVARYTSICTIIALAASMGWRLHQMDVKRAFLNGEIVEEVYIEQPDGFVIHEQKSHVCRLKKALCALKQAPRSWYEKMDGFLMSLGFNKSVVDPNLYYHIVGDECLILVLYVDDLFLTGSESLIVECKRSLTYEFEMKNLGMMHYFLGLEVCQRTDEIFLSQGKYTVEILKKFDMTDCKSMPTLMVMDLKKMNKASTDSGKIDPLLYRQLIGSLIYLVNTKPDICYVVNVLNQFMSQPRQTHWIATMHVLRYLRGTVGYGLRYASDVDMRLEGYVDADRAGSVVDRKSTSSCCFTLGFAMVSWCSRKQSSVALSIAEAEYIALCVAVREAVWLRKLLADLFGDEMDSTIIHCDNQVADVFTKPLARTKFEYFCERLGLVENASLAERECC